MSCKDHMWFVFPVWRTLCNVTGWWCHSLSAWPYISGWGHWLWFFFMGFFFFLLIMNPGRIFEKKNKALLPPFHVSVCSFFKDSLSCDLQWIVLFCCSLPCMWVSMQISLLCTGRNFPPWISFNRHMWGGWGGGHCRGCWWCRDGMYSIVISQCKSHLKRCKSLSILNFSDCFQKKGTYICLLLSGKKHFEWKF